MRFGARIYIRLLRLLRLSFIFGGYPVGVLRVEDWIKQYNNQNILLNQYTLCDSSQIEEHASLRANPNIPEELSSQIKKTIPPNYVLCLKNGRVWSGSASIVTQEGFLLEEVSRNFWVNGPQNGAMQTLRMGSLTKLGGRIAVLNMAGAGMYYHWMIDVLPRLFLLKSTGLLSSVDKLIASCAQKFQRESLDSLGIPKGMILDPGISKKFYVQAEELVVPSLVGYLDQPSRWVAQQWQAQFKSWFPSLRQVTNRKIFISRRLTTGRKLLNEDQIWNYLEPLGFELVELENMDFKAQLKLFNQCQTIVAPHGSGLTNILFCQSGTKVIDLMSPYWVNPCYALISEHCQLDYHCLLGVRTKFFEDELQGRGLGEDYRIDMGAFGETIQRIIKMDELKCELN